MIDMLLSVFSLARSNWIYVVIGALVLAALSGLWGWGTYYKSEYNAEVARHEATVKLLDLANKATNDWKSQVDASRNKNDALRGQVQGCLDNVSKVQADIAERDSIIRDLRVQTVEPDKVEVVDNETRSRVIQRLNRPLSN